MGWGGGEKKSQGKMESKRGNGFRHIGDISTITKDTPD